MPFPTPSPFSLIATGFRQLRRHPFLSLGIALLGALLSALGPLLQMRLGLPDDPFTQQALLSAAVFPLELYFVPRFLAFLDAETTGHPHNLLGDWKEHFERRWLKAFGIRVLLMLVMGGGLALPGLAILILPGLIILVLFGWAPLRVLLRGDSFLLATRNSSALMAKAWPGVIRASLLFLGSYLLLMVGLEWAQQHLVPNPSAWLRLAHPVIWLTNFLRNLLSLLLSTSFLALYLAVEPALEEAKEDAE